MSQRRDDVREQQIGAVYIPASIMCLESLTLTQKVLWGRIQGLATKEGYCYASNIWIGGQIGLNKGTVSNNISVLVHDRHVKRVIIRNAEGKIIERRLYPLLPDLSTGELTPINGEIDTPINGEVEESLGDKSNTEKQKTGLGKPTGRNGVTFPKEDYTAVTEAIKQIKGIDPQGSEWRPIQQTIKSMFMDGRKPDEIIGLMRALEDSSEGWTANWTMKTVRMKLPEWIAGKLKLGNRSDLITNSRPGAYSHLGAET